MDIEHFGLVYEGGSRRWGAARNRTGMKRTHRLVKHLVRWSHSLWFNLVQKSFPSVSDNRAVDSRMTEISSAIKEDHATWQSGMNIRSSSSINTPKRIETPDLTTDDEDPAPAPHPLIRENISFAPLPLSSANWSLGKRQRTSPAPQEIAKPARPTRVALLQRRPKITFLMVLLTTLSLRYLTEEERRRFMTDLASAPIGSSKDEQRKRVARRRTSTGLSERDHSMQPTANQQATRGECPPRLACSYMNEGRSI
ncbi:hypothetical protein GE21DRAFT_1308838 [Neurospora crassa]|nr:hypothetical protein GE21DRAFT_1308838 [Neurospora crassa]